MKTLESSLWRWLLVGARGPGVHLARVENSLSKSTPDVEASVGDGGFWIELKTAARPTRRSTLVRFKFQLGQLEWLRRRWALDRGAWLLVQVGSNRYMIPGMHAPAVDRGLTEEGLARLSVTTPEANPGEILLAASGHLGVRN